MLKAGYGGPVGGYFMERRLTSEDKPYLKNIPKVVYDKNAAKKNAFRFVLDSAQSYSKDYRSLAAFDFYGKIILNGEFFDSVNLAGNAFLNSGVKPDETVSMFCLNIPETFYCMYGLNDFGIATEWFNPLAISVDLLKAHITKNNIKTMVIIDVMYPIMKAAIQDTGIKQVIVTSVQDSFPFKMKLLYGVQVFGVNFLIKNPYFQYVIKEAERIMPSERVITEYTGRERKNILKRYHRFLLSINSYVQNERIMEKASFYCDRNKDERFIQWKDFINRFGEVNDKRCMPYEEGKTKFIVHTGGTTGPAKAVAHTDYAINSAVYQTSIMPLNIEYEDSFCQIVPPIVAYSLENMHLARYMQMKTHLIATYDRSEFPDIILNTRANHYNIVPSFAKVFIDSEKLEAKDLSFIKSCQYGGEGISPEDDKAIDKVLAGKGRHGFGQNEEFGCFTGNYDVPGITKAYGCCGFPLYGNGYIIVERETGKELPYGKDGDGSYYIGDLYVCGPTVMKGYLGEAANENENTIIYRNGEKYIRTGDEAYIDEEGRLWYWTREQRIIRTQQGKIFANIIEDILHKIPEIKDCCVVKSPHPRNVAEASCHIVLKQECWERDVNSVIEKIIKIVEAETQAMYSYYVPGTYEFRKGSLPMTPFGKIDFMLLEKDNIRQYEENNHLALQKIRIIL